MPAANSFAGARELLATVHRPVGDLEELAELGRVLGKQRASVAGIACDRLTAVAHRLACVLTQLLRDRVEILPRVDPFDDDGELVSSQAGHEIRATRDRLQTDRELAKNRISRGVAVFIVDRR